MEKGGLNVHVEACATQLWTLQTAFWRRYEGEGAYTGIVEIETLKSQGLSLEKATKAATTHPPPVSGGLCRLCIWGTDH